MDFRQCGRYGSVVLFDKKRAIKLGMLDWSGRKASKNERDLHDRDASKCAAKMREDVSRGLPKAASLADKPDTGALHLLVRK